MGDGFDFSAGSWASPIDTQSFGVQSPGGFNYGNSFPDNLTGKAFGGDIPGVDTSAYGLDKFTGSSSQGGIPWGKLLNTGLGVAGNYIRGTKGYGPVDMEDTSDTKRARLSGYGLGDYLKDPTTNTGEIAALFASLFNKNMPTRF